MFLYQIQESLDAIARDAQLEQARRNVMAQIHASCEWDAAIAHETMKHRVLSAFVGADPLSIERVVIYTGLGFLVQPHAYAYVQPPVDIDATAPDYYIDCGPDLY